MYSNLSSLYKLLIEYRKDKITKMIIFDSILNENKEILNSEIILIKLKSSNYYLELLKQMISFYLLIVVICLLYSS